MKERAEALVGREREVIGCATLNRFPIERYLAWFRSPDTEGSYSRFPGELRAWFDRIEGECGERVLSAYHGLAMGRLMLDSLGRLERPDIAAPAVLEATAEWIGRILDEREAEPNAELDAQNEFFKRDISVCALRMFPTRGPCQFEVGWLARRFLLTAGIRRFLPALKCWLFDLHLERRRLYTVHVDDRVVFRSFTAEGWRHTYEDVAAQMRLHSEIVGLHAASWFWDPRVQEISPKMAFLYEFPRSGGAMFFKLDADAAARKGALTNRVRRRLYEAGEYEPTNYLMIWPREKLLSFLS